jgi:oligosaccharide 4-alpha-D-glucosyltransferase
VFRKDAQEWFKKVYRTQTANGVSGWWTDLGEPEKHPAAIHHNLKDLGFKRLFKADEVHNIFGHYWNKMLYDFYTKEYPSTRIFHLNRSGYAGSPRYNIFPWTGDINRNWNGLKAQLPILMGMSLSGIPYIHSDAGGFTTTSEKDPELYTRWLQMAAFTPIFRPHAAVLEDLTPPGALNVESEPVFWPEPTKSTIRSLIQLRYDLTPYNYTLAYEQAKYGKPLIRPMFYKNFADSNLYKAEAQYMWGDNILVAPVLEKGAVTKNIYFPKGRWYDFMRNKFYDGGQWVTDSAKINEIPFFVKQGAFIPTVWSNKTMDNYSTIKFYIMYFPSKEKTFYEMYEDDGLTNKALEKNLYELLQMGGEDEGDKITITLKSNGGRFNKRPEKRTIRFYIADMDAQPGSINWNGKKMKNLHSITNKDEIKYEAGVCVYNPASRMLTVIVEFTDKPLVIELVK